MIPQVCEEQTDKGEELLRLFDDLEGDKVTNGGKHFIDPLPEEEEVPYIEEEVTSNQLTKKVSSYH